MAAAVVLNLLFFSISVSQPSSSYSRLQ